MQLLFAASGKVSEQVAVITGRSIVRGEGDVLREGRENRAIRITQVWVKSEERWLREAFQGTVFGEHVAQ